MKSIVSSRAGTDRMHFTLIELLVVIAIIAILMSVLLPSLAKSKTIANEMNCKGKLRQLALASRSYIDDNQGYGPFESTDLGWITVVGPYLGIPRDDLVGTGHPFPIMTCPTSDYKLSYLWQSHLAINLYTASGVYDPIKPDTRHKLPSQTFFFMDTWDGIRHLKPSDLVADSTRIIKILRHRGKANTVYLDGHVDMLTETPIDGNQLPWQSRS